MIIKVVDAHIQKKSYFCKSVKADILIIDELR